MNTATDPPETVPLPLLDAATFRLTLAGLADPTREPAGPAEPAAVKESALSILLIGRRLFNWRELDLKSVWTKLFASAEVALAAAGADDTTTFASELLGGIFANPSAVATDPELAAWVGDCGTDGVKDAVFRTSLLRLIRVQLPILPALVRKRYQAWKLANPTRAAAEELAAESENLSTESEDQQ